MEILDTDHDGNINIDEFLVGIRGKLNAKRQALVDKAFLKFDKDGSGEVTAADLQGVYNCDHHPAVIQGTKTKEQVFAEFLG